MGHGANKKGHHLHMVYKRNVDYPSDDFCGTTKDWETEWKCRLKENYLKNRGFVSKRGMESKRRFLEVLVVCDKRFIQFHKGITIQTYVMTVMNMVS